MNPATPPVHFRTRWVRLTVLGFCLLLPLIGGCAAAVIVHKVFGETVEAEYKPAEEPTLVLVENYQHPGAEQEVADNLAMLIGADLTAHEVGPIIDAQKLSALRTGRPEDYNKMSITALAREVGAKQVVYVDLMGAAVNAEPGSTMIVGRFAAQVRLIDAQSGQSLWPVNSDGYPVYCQTPIRNGQGPTAVHSRMLRDAAGRIARLFYSYKVDEVEQGPLAEQ